MARFVKKRDDKTARFDGERIKSAIGKAVKSVHVDEPNIVTERIYQKTLELLPPRSTINRREIDDKIAEASRQIGHPNVGNAYISYRDKRLHAREILGIEGNGQRDTTDTSLMIESDSKDSIDRWDRKRISDFLSEDLDRDLADEISKRVENRIVELVDSGVNRLTTTDIRHFVEMELRIEGLSNVLRRQAALTVPTDDLNGLIFKKSNENSNVASNNPEAVNLGIAELVQKPFALNNIFSRDVADAHFEGRIHLHDLGYPTRAYCSSHSVEYLKKFGLNKVLANLESKSDPPKSAAVLNQHIQTFLASMQAHYAGALGFGFLNILYASLLERPVDVVTGEFNGGKMSIEKRDLEKLVEQGIMSEDQDKENYFRTIDHKRELREVPQREYDQTAQNLIFAGSQNAFSRGGQTLFIDFNIHTGVPKYLKNVPAIGPSGKYMIRMENGSIEFVDDVPGISTENPSDPNNGDADDSQLNGNFKGGHIMVYGDYEKSTQRFAKSLLEVWRKGDKDGRPFHFPKCDLHVDEKSFENPKQYEVLDLAAEISSENGSVYFMFDRGDDAVLAQCCRLKEKIEDKSMLKYPERLRFTGFQNVTINVPQASYRGKNLEGTLEEISKAMELALLAHQEKAKFVQELLDTDGSPMRNLGVPSDDGSPYIDLKKSTYIIGMIGLNEAVQNLTGSQLHENENAFRTGLEIIAHMYLKAQEFKNRTGSKFVIEETPAESTTRRLAKLDRKKYEEAKKVIKGTEESPYYTNSIHFAPDAHVGIIDRIVGQSMFHDPFIQAGAIIHAWTGERRPDKQAILSNVRQTLNNTRCSQLVYSPTYTECDSCGTIMAGEKELCVTPGCMNHSVETLDPNTLTPVTRIVGYYSRIKNWNGSQIQINEDRKKAEAFYAGDESTDMSWLYNPNGNDRLRIIQFAKNGCVPCQNTHQNIETLLEKLELNGKVDFEVHYLDTPTRKGLVDAALYSVPFDVFPSVVVTGKNSYWSKTASYGQNGEGNDLIRPREIREAVVARLPEYGLAVSK